MARLLVVLFALFALVAPPLARAEPADIAAAARSVVRVVLIEDSGDGISLIGYGSGFAVAPDLIVTNAHVVEDVDDYGSIRIGIVPSQGKTGWFAKVMKRSPGNDLALLRLTEHGSLPPATLFAGPVGDGSDVYAVGYPGNVDLAQGLEVGDIVRPIAPVKTHGNVSSGRSSKAFDTILHTASLGAGNSGGPLLDSCGRVIGANSFGALSQGSDSEFFFAVSMREIMRFLRENGVTPRIGGGPCKSIADLDRADNELLAAQRTNAAEAARTAESKQAAAIAGASRQAELEVIAGRENGMALAGLGLVLALVAGAGATWLSQQKRKRDAMIAAGAGIALLLGSVVAWTTRPTIGDIDERAKAIVAEASPSGGASPSASREGALRCVLDPSRSRVTVSQPTDVPIDWGADGCVNKRTQYGLAEGNWSRILVPKSEDTVTVASFDPAAGVYKTERYLLDIEAMDKARELRDGFTPPSCGAGEDAARELAKNQTAIRALLPTAPNERMVYNCRGE